MLVIKLYHFLSDLRYEGSTLLIQLLAGFIHTQKLATGWQLVAFYYKQLLLKTLQ